MKLIALDLEFTGLNKKFDRIIEIGACKVDTEHFNETVDTFDRLINIVVPLPERITGLTGITKEMLVSGVPEEEAVKNFLDFADDCNILLGHNIPCDFAFLKTAMQRYGLDKSFFGIDTLRIARACLPELEKKTLEALCTHYSICQTNAHRAFEDALSAARLYYILEKTFKISKPDVFEPVLLEYKEKKQSPAMKKQIKQLQELVEKYYPGLTFDYDKLTKSEASHHIDVLKSNISS